jgi:hypothetical protein
MMRPPVSTADLLRAFAEIRPDTDEEKRSVAHILGFDWEAPLRDEDVDLPAPVPAPVPLSVPLPVPKVVAPTGPTPKSTLAEAGVPRHAAPQVRFRISGPNDVERPKLDWLASTEPLGDRPMGRAPKPVPLFRPQWTRAILGASLSTQTPTGPPDMDRVVEIIAQGGVMRFLPRQRVMTLAHGVQVLLDVGEGMQPFSQDRATLLRDLKRIVGDGALDVLRFSGSLRKVRRGRTIRRWRAYTGFPPQLGACVLVVSDFGIGRSLSLSHGASPSTWLAFAKRLNRRGHRVVGFLPYPPSRWPLLLARAVVLVQWDRSTSVGRIRFARPRSASL